MGIHVNWLLIQLSCALFNPFVRSLGAFQFEPRLIKNDAPVDVSLDVFEHLLFNFTGVDSRTEQAGPVGAPKNILSIASLFAFCWRFLGEHCDSTDSRMERKVSRS